MKIFSFFQLWLHIQGDLYVVNCQRAAPNVQTTLAHFKMPTYLLVGCQVVCAKMISVTSSEGFLMLPFVI